MIRQVAYTAPGREPAAAVTLTRDDDIVSVTVREAEPATGRPAPIAEIRMPLDAFRDLLYRASDLISSQPWRKP